MEPPANVGHRVPNVRVALVQTKPRKGQYRENLDALTDVFRQLGEKEPPDLIVLPEAALTGYFLEGAVYELALEAPRFADDLVRVWRAANGARPVDITCGFFENADGTYYNSALYLEISEHSHTIKHVHRKMFLPTYGVFDEERFLSRGRRLSVFETRFGPVAILICEDVWHAIMPTIAAVKGARITIVPSAAPGRGIEDGNELSSITRWRGILQSIAAEHGIYLLYAGLAGFEGGKGMTGSSSVIDPQGRTIVQAPATGACIVKAELDLREIDLARASLPLLGDLNAVLPDLLLDEELPLPRGVRDAAGH
ncbi:MAG: beta-ureidopropionase [Candidatus Eremiobacteraeota bacterium]|nr:beta-ureidopropionase [Candidatus Eremiobacteraeota bacterium]